MKDIKKENSKSFVFGKIDFDGIGRKINTVEIEVGLREYSDGSYSFTASVNVWNHIHTDIVAGGQMFDAVELSQIEARSSLFATIKELWRKYHLNDMHAGTPEQEEALEKANLLSVNDFDFDKACEFLKNAGLYEVEYEGKPYRYGSGWLHFSISKKDLEKIHLILNTPQIKLEELLKDKK